MHKSGKRYLKIKSGYEDVLIDLQNVLYIEKRRNQCVFHKIDEEISCYEPLKMYMKDWIMMYLCIHIRGI